MLEGLSREIRSGFSEELLFADDLALVIETFESPKWRLKYWQGALESSFSKC